MTPDPALLGIPGKFFVLLSVLLLACYGAAHLARWHWFFDLLSHFLVQYAFFALVFCAILFVLKMYPLSLLMLSVSLASFYETRRPLAEPWRFSAPPRDAKERNIFRVAQYNKHYDNKNFAAIADWLNQSPDSIDIVFLLEVEPEDADALRGLTAKLYPYAEPAEGVGPDFSLILSRHKPLSVERKKVAPDMIGTRGTRVEMQPEGFKAPIAFYSVHTRVPLPRRGQARRNAELNGLAEWIAQDQSPYKIAVGDWNITPYSPYFSDFLKVSGLKYQTHGVFPPGTWVSYFTLPFLKIPIDHMAYGPGLTVLEIKSGPSFGSDHQALVGVFAVRRD